MKTTIWLQAKVIAWNIGCRGIDHRDDRAKRFSSEEQYAHNARESNVDEQWVHLWRVHTSYCTHTHTHINLSGDKVKVATGVAVVGQTNSRIMSVPRVGEYIFEAWNECERQTFEHEQGVNDKILNIKRVRMTRRRRGWHVWNTEI